MHACLRKSWDHLSPECKAAEEGVEKLEHEDVRLNPKIQKECPSAIAQFCGDVPPGNANVIGCLQAASAKPEFPEGCRAVMAALLERSSVKYSLNSRLKAKCDADVAKLCPGAKDEPQKAADPSILGCLAGASAQLSGGCRAELAALVRVHLNRYRIGMPLTSPCDGDVLARCNVDKQVTPFLLGGYIQSCLTKNVDKLHKPCWSLLSMFDASQFNAATTLEAKHWTPELQAELTQKVTEKVTEQVVAEVRRELEPQLINKVHSRVDSALAQHSSSIKPLLFALINAVSLLVGALAVLGLVGWYVWTKYIKKGTTRTVAIKDGRV
uniref:Golgi apparatus protein 1 n=1 Tax=Chlamydomonas leiostraca TaxID=1034604 RepID=A0A7S0RUV0_9CHLO